MQVLNGFVKIHRKLLQWGWYQDNVVKGVFIHILLTASFKDTYWMGRLIKKGQVVVGVQKMADELGFTRQQVRTAINRLKSTNEITTETTNKFTIITVVNWDEYQYLDEEDATNKTTSTSTNEQPTTNQQLTNKQPYRKNVKECKECKENIYGDTSPTTTTTKFCPPSIEEVQAYCLERTNGINAEQFVDYYTSNGWKVGKNKMKDWKAAVRIWERNNKKSSVDAKIVKPSGFNNFEQKKTENYDAIKRKKLEEIVKKGGAKKDA